VDLKQLDHFVAVAEEHNFTRAAQRVHIVQSALSTSIRGLEEELGTPLFRRGARKVTLTPAGEIMLDRARRVLKDVREVRDAVAGVDGLLVGRLAVCVGLIQGLNPYINVIDLLARFHEKHPGVHLRVRQMPTEPSLDELRSDQAEIALVAPSQPMPAGFNVHVYARDDFAAVCCHKHRFTNRKSIEASELTGETFVDLTRQWHIRRSVDAYCRNVKLDRQISCEVNELTTLFDLVCAGLGMAIVPRQLAMQYHQHLTLLDLTPAVPQLEWGAIIMLDPISGKPRLSAAARAFMAMIEETTGAATKKKARS
jgi:DNA-binding transcriptional LysR family regulator